MTDLEIANMLADYHKECDATEELAEKGRIQLKHARLIREKVVKNCSTPDVSSRRELLKGFASKFNDKLDRGDGVAIMDWMIDEFLETL